ncbi:MAG: ABC transporter ATP-binding protein [Spirochaetales bacterium]|jgi:NitT/TauT family transport system ATP-binding protein|nr:ABC transporter ATP-binding protein [Spirochaetales bacterium]HPB41924.1 ABC transporter ATP-binding protein [Sphaerochaeta sp.]HPY44825.1 ABC transporter ATP-binding protein [Sphaerochaeta sp.]HQB04771.1 ABC transporter ATP-binding protein [Sphaerochaeta sp.]
MRFSNVSKAYGDHVVFDRFSFALDPKTIMSVVGPSGGGKTTLLRLAAGLVEPDGGTVEKDEGKVSFLFQEPRLLPHVNVWANVEITLRAFYEQEERTRIALHYLELAEMKESLHLYPHELSGGMRQRVAIARAFAHPAELMLLDEPFQSLDIRLRMHLIKAFLTLWEEEKRTTIFVTHDTKEAVLIGDRVLCLGDPHTPRMDEQIKIPRTARDIHDPVLMALEVKLFGLLTRF